MGRRGGEQYRQDPYPEMGNPQKGGKLQQQRFSQRSQGSEPHIRLPSLEVLHKEDKFSEHLALKGSGAYFQESQRAIANRLRS